MENVEQATEQEKQNEEVNASAEKAEEKVEEAGEKTTPEEEKKTESAKEPEGGKKEPPAWAKKRFDELTRKRIEAEKEAAFWRGKAEGQKQEEKKETPEQEPNPAEFTTYDEFIKAQARWEARQELKAEREKEKAEKEKENFHRIEEERRGKAAKQATAARNELDDFDEVLSNPDFPRFAKEVVDAITDSDVGAKIAYYLGKNLTEANRIAGLNPLAAAREIGKIEGKILNPPKVEPKRITSAGEPVKTVGEKAANEIDPEKLSMNDWVRWRDQQVRKGA